MHNLRPKPKIGSKIAANFINTKILVVKMKRKIISSLKAGAKFKKEFRRQIRMLIIVTLGFTIAFSWRQTVFDASQSIVQFFTNVQSSTALSVLTSLFITIVAVILIYLAAHYLKDNHENY